MGSARVNILRLKYSSAVSDMEYFNSSFDKGVMRVAYTGDNRNKSNISKEAFERNIFSAVNCPVVCNYDRETNSIGGHDVAFVTGENGKTKLVNLTQPVGIVPESANYWWEEAAEKDGKVHEYLCLEVLIWKRQEAYQKIKENGVTDQSMEIAVKNSETVDGICHIKDFEFLAFCLLGNVEPCFESAGLNLMSYDENRFEMEYSKMLKDFKEAFSGENAKMNINNLTKGEKDGLKNFENEVVKKPIAKSPDDDTEDPIETEKPLETAEAEAPAESEKTDGENSENAELSEVISEDAQENEASAEQSVDNSAIKDGENGEDTDFSLTQTQFKKELLTAIKSETFDDNVFGTVPRFWLEDYSIDKSLAYVYDITDENIYSLPYSVHGDAVSVDFKCKKRQKLCYEDFIDGTAAEAAGSENENSGFFSHCKNMIAEKLGFLTKENDELKRFKADILKNEKQAEQEKVLGEFDDLKGIDEFEALFAMCEKGELDKSAEELQTACYAIRGKNIKIVQKQNGLAAFSVRIPVGGYSAKSDNDDSEDDGYNGLIKKYRSKISD